MKQFLLFILFTCFTISYGQQNIGFLGGFNGWGDDIDMTSSDNIVFSKNNYYLPAGEIKFREGNNWSGSQWPGSGNYNVNSAGFYDISLDTSNGSISLTSSQTGFDQNISLIGDFNAWTDTVMTTTDNITYTLTGVSITAGTVKFRRESGWQCNWGDNAAADGIADPNSGDNIAISADDTYDVTFNLSTLAYSITVSNTASVVKLSLKDQLQVYYDRTFQSINVDVSLAASLLEYQIFDISGKLTGYGVLHHGLNTINIDPLSKGLYVIDVQDASTQERAVKKIIKY
jgi:hypothetical protein